MNKISILILIIFFTSVLYAVEGPVLNIKNKNFTQSVLTDSVRKKDVWAKNYHQKSPFAAGLMSAFIPGLGHLYNGQYLKAGLFLGGELVLISSAVASANSYTSNTFTSGASIGMAGFWVGLWLGVRIWGVVDAATSARDINEKWKSEGNKPVSLIYFSKDGVQNMGLAIHF